MSDLIKTVKVAPWGKDQGDFVEINETDFDEKTHKLYEEPKPKKEPKQKAE